MKHVLGSVVLSATLFAVGGCVVTARGRVVAPPPPVATVEIEVEEEPPPPRTVVVETRPGFVFVEGRWYRRGGRWERRGRHHVWIEGSWRASATTRDHRH